MKDNKKLEGAARYTAYMAEMTSDTVEDLRHLAIAEMYFRDPFNEFNDVEKVIRALADMFETVPDARFHIIYQGWADDHFILKWRFTGHAKYLGAWEFFGLSEIQFNAEGLAISHIDFWDASVEFYMKLPIIGMFIRWVRNRLRID